MFQIIAYVSVTSNNLSSMTCHCHLMTAAVISNNIFHFVDEHSTGLYFSFAVLFSIMSCELKSTTETVQHALQWVGISHFLSYGSFMIYMIH